MFCSDVFQYIQLYTIFLLYCISGLLVQAYIFQATLMQLFNYIKKCSTCLFSKSFYYCISNATDIFRLNVDIKRLIKCLVIYFRFPIFISTFLEFFLNFFLFYSSFSSTTLLTLKFSKLLLLFSENCLTALLFINGFPLLKMLFSESLLTTFPLFSNFLIGLFSANMLLTVFPIHEKAFPIGSMIDFQKLEKSLSLFAN